MGPVFLDIFVSKKLDIFIEKCFFKVFNRIKKMDEKYSLF